jgi:hypothetical protein
MDPLRKLLILGAAALSMVVALPAFAKVVTVDEYQLKGGALHGGSSTWDVTNGDPYDHDGTGDGQCVIFDKKSFTPASDGELFTSDPEVSYDDIYDGGMGLLVGGEAFLDHDSLGTKSGEELTVGPETLRNLHVSERVTALQGRAILRVLAIFKNPTTTAIAKTVTYDTSLGSDDDGYGTDIVASSADDGKFTPTDRWLLTAQPASQPKDLDDDPPVLQVFRGPGKVREKIVEVPFDPTKESDGKGTYCVTAKYRIRVPAGKTRSLVWFTEMNFTRGEGKTAAARYNKNRDAFFTGMSQKAKNKVLNWDLKPAK